MGGRPTHSFFKIFLNDSVNALRLPPAFVQKTGGVSPGRYLLQGFGKIRSVKLEKVGEDLYFQEGWRRFVQDTCVECGDFLVFTFCGDSIFSIKVYGRSGCEKVLTSTGSKPTDPPTTFFNEKGKQAKGVEKVSPHAHTRIKTGGWPFKAKEKIVIDLECEPVVEDDSPSKTDPQNRTSAWIHGNLQGFPSNLDSALECGPSYTRNSRKRSRDTGHEHVEEEMDKSSLEILGSSYPAHKLPQCPNIPVAKRHSNIPIAKRLSFSRIYMTRSRTPKSQKSDVIQASGLVCSSKALDCGPSCSKKLGKPKDKQYEEHKKKEIEVKPMDCKAFGTSRNNSLTTPVAKRSFCAQVKVTKQQPENHVRQEAKIFEPQQPFATVTLTKSYVKKGYLHFPYNFVHSYLFKSRYMKGVDKLTRDVKLRNADGRMWRVKLNYYSNIARLTFGWGAFVRQNNLREGDICFFELLKMGSFELKFSMIRPQGLLGRKRRRLKRAV